MENNFLFELGDKTKDQGCCQELTNHEQSSKKCEKKIIGNQNFHEGNT